METTIETKKERSFELLKMYGSRWAILAAMSLDLSKKGFQLPETVKMNLEVTRIKIASGCYSTCEIDCSMNRVEGHLISAGASLGEHYIDYWMDLMARSMQGLIDFDNLIEIPAVKPIESACGFLNCNC